MIFNSGILRQDLIGTENSSYYSQLKSLFLISCICFFYGLSAGINIHGFGLFFEKFDLSSIQISRIFSIDIVGGISISSFVMLLTYNLGLYRIIVFALFLRNIAVIIFLFSVSYEIICCSMFFFGIAGFIIYTSIFQWANYLTVDKVRATYIAVVITAFGLGIALGPVLLVLTNLEVETTLWISIMISFFILVPLAYLKNSAPIFTEYKPIKISYLIYSARIPIICAFAADYIFYAIQTFLPEFVMSYGYLQQKAYLIMGYFGLSGLLLSIPFGIILDRYNRIRILMLFSLAIAVCMQIMPQVINNINYTLILFLILSSSLNGIIICVFTMLGDKFRGGNLILANSLVHAISAIGGYAGVRATSSVVDNMGNRGLIFSISSLFLVFLGLLLVEAYKYNKNNAQYKSA